MCFYTLPLSVRCYFMLVGIVTVMVFVLLALFRPTLIYGFREFVGWEDPRFMVSPTSFYATRIAPVFESRCNSCHGPERQKANLRMDSLGRLMLGGRNGLVIHAANIEENELFRRLILPPTHDKAMPPEGKTPLKNEEIAVIRLWIEAGASGTQPVEDFKNAPPPPVEITFEEVDPAAIKAARAPLADTVLALQARNFTSIIAYESRGSADLHVNASLLGKKFGDADLAELDSLSSRIVWADFSGTAITDASVQVLSDMSALRILRLTNTAVTDITVEALSPLQNLQSLNTFGTRVTTKALGTLKNKVPIRAYDIKEGQLNDI